MPFNDQQPQRRERDPNLTRLGGLYPSKTGKALAGNVNLAWVDRNTNETVGKKLIEMIERAMDDNLPLRFLIFDNTDRGGNPPYVIHVTYGNQRPATIAPQGAPPIARRPPDQPKADPVPDWVGAFTEEPTETPEPEPVPRMSRRGPPRR